MKKFVKYASKAFNRILDVFGIAACIVIVAIMLAVSVKVVFRYFLFIRLMGVDELSESALLYITFLGGAWLLRQNGHVSIDILFVRLSKKTCSLLTAVTAILGASVCAILVYSGTIATMDVWTRGVFTPTILEIPKAAILCIIPLGSALLVVEFLRLAWASSKTIWDEKSNRTIKG